MCISIFFVCVEGARVFRWLVLVSGNRPSGLFLWFWHQHIYTIQKETKNIVNVNYEFWALILTYKFVQHNLSAIETTAVKYSSIQIQTISRTRWSLIIYKPTLILLNHELKKNPI